MESELFIRIENLKSEVENLKEENIKILKKNQENNKEKNKEIEVLNEKLKHLKEVIRKNESDIYASREKNKQYNSNDSYDLKIIFILIS